MINKLIIYALTLQGAELGHRLAGRTRASLWLPHDLAGQYQAQSFDSLLPAVGANFGSFPGHIFICATGIAVRAIAPHLQGKSLDPAVVVLDQDGKYCISLLSGHLGGANELTLHIADILGAEPVISTATDNAGIQAVDLLIQEKGLQIKQTRALAAINMALLQGNMIQIHDPWDRLGLAKDGQTGYHMQQVHDSLAWQENLPGIWVAEQARIGHLRPDLHLQLIPRCLILGLGCNRGTSAAEILELIVCTCVQKNLSLRAIAALASITAKKNEPGLLETARILGAPLEFVSPEELGRIQAPHPSETVYVHMGVYSVCEAAAMIRARSSQLLTAKTKTKNATLAIALREP